jgi:hypothetical protein
MWFWGNFAMIKRITQPRQLDQSAVRRGQLCIILEIVPYNWALMSTTAVHLLCCRCLLYFFAFWKATHLACVLTPAEQNVFLHFSNLVSTGWPKKYLWLDVERVRRHAGPCCREALSRVLRALS